LAIITIIEHWWQSVIWTCNPDFSICISIVRIISFSIHNFILLTCSSWCEKRDCVRPAYSLKAIYFILILRETLWTPLISFKTSFWKNLKNQEKITGQFGNHQVDKLKTKLHTNTLIYLATKECKCISCNYTTYGNQSCHKTNCPMSLATKKYGPCCSLSCKIIIS